MNKNNAGFIAFVGAIVVVAIGAFIVAPKLYNKAVDTASHASSSPAPAAGVSGEAAMKSDGDPSQKLADAPSEGETDKVKPADKDGVKATKAADTADVPVFDVLRVEPDGSAVIAGKAEPDTTMKIMNGDAVIASVPVGATGDFAAVLDKPLASGDYQLTLKSVSANGAVHQSKEVAIVSVPKDGSTELLAMVTTPGKASRIIEQPEAAPAAAMPALATDGQSGQTLPAGDVVAAADTGMNTPEDAAQTPKAAAIEMPALPAASSLMTTTAPQIAVPEVTTAETGLSSAPVKSAAEEKGAAVAAPEMAKVEPEAVSQSTGAQASVAADVRVNAVELEGDKIFVAGSALAGYKVRVLADDVVIGTETADKTGRFVVEAVSKLSVGDHIITAELLDKTTQAILLRATVPFNRPAGEAVAAVAPSIAQAQAGAQAAAGAQADASMAVAAPATKSADAIAVEKGDGGAMGEASSDEPSGEPEIAAPKTIEQAPLAPKPGSVIIRRGDTLWQIARRTYGEGVRYTTIYLANRSQIHNPNLIQPGQVFSVPVTPIKDAEKLHRKLLLEEKKLGQ